MQQPGEPLWLPDDTEKALAFQAVERQACPRCGTAKSDWFDDEGLPIFPPPYEAVAKHCEGCSNRERLQLDIKAQANANGDAETAERATAGLSVVLDRYDPTA